MVRRNTNQRKIVFDSLEFLGHATTEQLISYIEQKYEKISLATIYRNLVILESEGLIKKISIDCKDIYETVKSNHYHFSCTKCNKIIDIDPKIVDDKLKNINVVNGNIVKNYELTFYGLCEDCKNKLN